MPHHLDHRPGGIEAHVARSGVEILAVDKRRFVAELARLRTVLASRRFDLLLHMQASMRASLLSTLVRAPIKLGFDRKRARELQWLFTNRQIAPRRREHVLDSFMGFLDAVGITASIRRCGSCRCRPMLSRMHGR